MYTAASANVYRYKVHTRSVSENSCSKREWSPYTLNFVPARLFICTDTFILLACKPHDYRRSTVHWWTSSLTRNCAAFRPDLAVLAKRSRTTTRQAEEQVNSVSLRGKHYNELFEIIIYMYSWNFTQSSRRTQLTLLTVKYNTYLHIFVPTSPFTSRWNMSVLVSTVHAW